MSALTRRLCGAGAALAAASSPTIAAAQSLAHGHPIELPLIRLVGGLLLCTLIAVVAALLLKRFVAGGGVFAFGKAGGAGWLKTGLVRVLETHRISPHADLCRLVCGQTEYLVVVSPGGATVLREAKAEEPKS